MQVNSESVQSLPVCFVSDSGTELVQSNTSSNTLQSIWLWCHQKTWPISCWNFKHGSTLSDMLGPRISWKSVLGLWEERSFKGLGWKAKKKAGHFSSALEILGLVQVWLSKIWVCGMHIHRDTKEILHLENSHHQDWQPKRHFPTKGMSSLCV